MLKRLLDWIEEYRRVRAAMRYALVLYEQKRARNPKGDDEAMRREAIEEAARLFANYLNII